MKSMEAVWKEKLTAACLKKQLENGKNIVV